jgi:chromate transport protein ChrA
MYEKDMKNFKDLQNISNQISNIKKSKKGKNRKANILLIFGIILEITGYSILISHLGYIVAGGLFCLFWSKNIGSYLKNKEKEK